MWLGNIMARMPAGSVDRAQLKRRLWEVAGEFL